MFEMEKFSVYHLSPKAKVIVKDGSGAVTLVKRVSAMQEISLRITRDELSALFHVLNMRTLTEDAIKSMTKGDDHADKE